MLEDLFTKYGTDKGVNGYAPVYEKLLGERRENIRTVLEVGIGTMNPDALWNMNGWALPGYRPGGSLRAWRDWFPTAMIHGMDTQPDCMFSENRIGTLLANSQDIRDVWDVLGDNKFDVIIDDADHSLVGQFQTFTILYPHLASGGIYIIEDARDFNHAGLGVGGMRYHGSNMRNDMVVFSK